MQRKTARFRSRQTGLPQATGSAAAKSETKSGQIMVAKA